MFYTGYFFSSTNTNISITQKVIDRIKIRLKRFEEESHRYKMVKSDQKFVKNLSFYRRRLKRLYLTIFHPLTLTFEFEKYQLC